MEPGMSMQIDDREFQAALRQYLAKTEKSLAPALNTKMFYIGRGAHRNTPQADRSKIEAELGVIAYKISKSKKTGKFARRKAIVGGSGPRLVYAIINARLGRAGKKGLQGKEMAAAAKRLLGKRFRGIGTEKDGWLHAIRKFGAAIGQGFTKDGGAGRLKGKSVGTVAKDGWNPECTLEYNVNSYDTKHKQYLDPRTVRALQQAFTDETRSMQEHLRKKLQPIADQHNGR